MNAQLRERFITVAQQVLGLSILLAPVTQDNNSLFRVLVLTPTAVRIDIGMISEHAGKLTQGRSFNETLDKILKAM